MSKTMITITDILTLPEPVLKDNAMDYTEDVLRSNKGSYLLVRSKATWSGYLLNNRTYPGRHMRDGIHTWTDKNHGGTWPHNAPVLKGHDTKSEPLGRVVKATYVPLINGNDFMNDWRAPATGLNQGSGYTKLTMEIRDADAIAKFLDGRYATFSTSFRSPNVYCSICGTDLMADSHCGHRPGSVYEVEDYGEVGCYLITGAMFNKEVSVEHDQAQPYAVAEEIELLRDAFSDRNLTPDEFASKYHLHGIPVQYAVPAEVTLMDNDGNRTVLNKIDGESPTISYDRNSVRPTKTVLYMPSTPRYESFWGLDNTLPATTETTVSETGAGQETTMPDEKKNEGGTLDTVNLQSLLDELGAKRDEIAKAKAEVASRDEEIEALKAKVTELQSNVHKANADTLAIMRAVTRREVDGFKLDSEEAVDKHATELADRTAESLSDSIQDERKMFAARLPHLSGLPSFIKDQVKPAPEAIVHDETNVNQPVTKGTKKQASNPADLI